MWGQLGVSGRFLGSGPDWGFGQKNVRNPNHHYFSKKYIAVRLQIVLQYTSNWWWFGACVLGLGS